MSFGYTSTADLDIDDSDEREDDLDDQDVAASDEDSTGEDDTNHDEVTAEPDASTLDRKPSRAQRTARSGGRKPITMAGASRAIQMYLSLRDADDEKVGLAAASLDHDADDLVGLAATVVSGRKTSTLGIVLDLFQVADDPYEATMQTVALGKDRVKQGWGLLARAGAVSGSLPSKETAAAVALARAVGDLDDDQRELFRSAHDLIGRSTR